MNSWTETGSHIYMGSLLAAVFDAGPRPGRPAWSGPPRKELLAKDWESGAVMPPDFHTDSLKATFTCGNEAGDPYR